jgi:hypothetical protein
MDTYTFHVATIRTLNGPLDIYWSFETRSIRYFCGGLGFDRPNQNIRTSLAALFGCPEHWLETRSLILSEGTYKTVFDNEHKMAKELLDCEWSDYAMDLMSFQIHLALGADINVRDDHFYQLEVLAEHEEQQIADDPQNHG